MGDHSQSSWLYEPLTSEYIEKSTLGATSEGSPLSRATSTRSKAASVKIRPLLGNERQPLFFSSKRESSRERSAPRATVRNRRSDSNRQRVRIERQYSISNNSDDDLQYSDSNAPTRQLAVPPSAYRPRSKRREVGTRGELNALPAITGFRQYSASRSQSPQEFALAALTSKLNIKDRKLVDYEDRILHLQDALEVQGSKCRRLEKQVEAVTLALDQSQRAYKRDIERKDEEIRKFDSERRREKNALLECLDKANIERERLEVNGRVQWQCWHYKLQQRQCKVFIKP